MRRITLAIAALVAIAASATTASAKPGGITGASGKSGSYCNKCHSGGAQPTVKLEGPAMLAPGATANYTFTITGGAAVAGGLDAALDDASLAAGASLATVTANTRVAAGEVTHSQPHDFVAGSLSFVFAVQAPASARVMTIYVAGNSVNHDGKSSGDRANATTLAVSVGAADLGMHGPVAADLAASATDDLGAASDLMSAPSPTGRDLATPAGDPGSAGPPAGETSPPNGRSSSGCSAAPGRGDFGGDFDGGPSALLWCAAILMLLSARRALRSSSRPATRAAAASWRAHARR
jgi:hypothetical protein